MKNKTKDYILQLILIILFAITYTFLLTILIVFLKVFFKINIDISIGFWSYPIVNFVRKKIKKIKFFEMKAIVFTGDIKK